MKLLDALLCGFRWYRRLRGQAWERWCTEGGGSMWCRVFYTTAECRKIASPLFLPFEGARGTPLVEDYRRLKVGDGAFLGRVEGRVLWVDSLDEDRIGFCPANAPDTVRAVRREQLTFVRNDAGAP